jgi:pyruvate/2-oxoglutarate dehydrogenase complex dihydrolipoamide acyltransferase (E2) component
VRWRQRAGDHISPGDYVCELEFDDGVLTIAADHYGVFEPLVQAGARCKVGNVIATIENPVDDSMYEIAVPEYRQSFWTRLTESLFGRKRSGSK